MTDLDDLAKLADDLARPQRAVSTRRVYATDWRMFTEWCAVVGQPADPATSDTIRLYLVHLLQNDIAYVTMLKKLSSISQALTDAGHPGKAIAWHPTVRRVLAGIKRREDEAGRQAQRAKPLRIPDLRKISASIDPNTSAGLRDWALILIQFSGALRRSEVAALELADVIEVPQGLEVRIRRSKRDQAGRGFTIGIPWGQHQGTCPVLAWQAWRCQTSR